MKRAVSCLALILLMLPLAAQIDFPRPNLNPFRGSQNSLMNIDKMAMSHSMGFEAGTSSGGDGYYLSRYTNHIKYKFNPKLELDLDLNFVNFGSMNTRNKLSFNEDNANKLIPEFALRYRPTDSIKIEIQMSQGGYQYRPRRAWYESW